MSPMPGHEPPDRAGMHAPGFSDDDEATPGPWRVLRLDDNGNEFVVATGLTREQAQGLVREYEATGHKQCYWMDKP